MKFLSIGLLLGVLISLFAMIVGPAIFWGLLALGVTAVVLDRVVTRFARI